MKYAQEIMDLMSAFPGRTFRMREIVQSVIKSNIIYRDRSRVKKGVWRVLQQLEEIDTITIIQPEKSGTGAGYVWKK
ncbi:MAG: hypothetical protein ON057_001575 [Glomeribacter sp. 1016415]|nr:hypothetical protein [Glomeribacter sp. 1016415]